MKGLSVLMIVANAVVRDPRVTKEARELSSQGHDVVILGIGGEVRGGERPHDGYRIRIAGSALDWLLRLRRRMRRSLAGAAPHQSSGSRRRSATRNHVRAIAALVQLAAVTLSLAQHVRKARRARADVIHVHDFNAFIIGALIQAGTGTPLIYDSHEVWSELGNYPSWYRGAIRALERALLRVTAARVIVVSDSMAAWFRNAHGVTPEAVVTNAPALPDGFVPPDCEIGATLRLIYQGGLIPGRGLEELIEVSQQLPSDVEVIVRGEGPLEPRLRAIAEQGGRRCRVLPSVPPAEVVVSAARDGDVGVILFEQGGVNHEVALPNKLFEYFSAGLPVLATRLRELESFAKLHGGVEFVDALGPSGILAACAALRQPGVMERLRAEVRQAWRAGVVDFRSSAQRLTAVYDSISARRPIE